MLSMSAGPLVQIGVLVFMTHGFRALGRRLGPQRGGLVMGLPSTTAMVLLSCAAERGVGDASLAAEAALAGLVAAVSLPLAYARAARRGWPFPAAAVAGVFGYLAVAAGSWWLPRLGAAGCAVGAAAGLSAACLLGRRVGLVSGRAGTPARGGRPGPARRGAASRTLIPALYVLAARLLGALAGPLGTGRLLTFPGMSLAVLASTHAESGAETACRLAVAMPVGSLGTLAFLTVFRFGCPRLGLGWGTAAGYAAALVVLLAAGLLAGAGRPPGPPPSPGHKCRVHPGGPPFPARSARRRRTTPGRSRRQTAGAHPRPRVTVHRRRFSPRVETLAD